MAEGAGPAPYHPNSDPPPVLHCCAGPAPSVPADAHNRWAEDYIWPCFTCNEKGGTWDSASLDHPWAPSGRRLCLRIECLGSLRQQCLASENPVPWPDLSALLLALMGHRPPGDGALEVRGGHTQPVRANLQANLAQSPTFRRTWRPVRRNIGACSTHKGQCFPCGHNLLS